MIKRLLLMFLISGPVVAFAQTGSVKGTIKDAESGEPLIGASVVVKGTTKGGIANLSGDFNIKNVPTGTQTLEFSYVGYEDFALEVTVTDGQETLVETINLESTAVGLAAVEIFASVVEDRRTPIAVSAIKSKEIEERHVGASLAEIVNNTPGVYSIQGAGGYGDNEVYIRGFDQSNVAFLVNGIPVNDMENGRMFWSNFAGLNEVTRQLQVQRGLGASKLAISSIGGTVNMITKPAEKSEGGRLEYQFGTGSWNERLRFSYHTGESDNGWAVSFQGSRTRSNAGLIGLSNQDQGTVLPGAYVNGYSYYLAISKKINKQHQLMFWGFGAPLDRGTAWIVDDLTRDKFNLEGPSVNGAYGIYQGEYINARQNKIDKPLMALTHYWDMNANTNLTTSVYASFANVYSTQPRDGESSLFFPTRNPGDPEFTSENLIDWDYLAAQNTDPSRYVTIQNPGGNPNVPSVSGFESQYYLEARYNNHQWVGAISNFRKIVGDYNLLAGIDVRHYQGAHFAEVHELFGGDFVVNQSSFGDEYNKLQPNSIARKGDRINYDYDGVINWAAAFVQAERSWNNFDAFATFSYTNSWYQRVGNFWNSRPRYNLNSLGESETKYFGTYTFKAGVNYRPTNRHNFFANGGYYTRPPFFRDSYADARYSSQLRQNLTEEKIAAFEVGYGYRTSAIRANVNAYYTNWQDRTTTGNFENNDAASGDLEFVPFSLPGLNSLHKGVELDFKYNVLSSLELSGWLSYGDWEWENSVSQQFTDESGNLLDERVYPMEGLPVGTSAQTTAGLGVHFSGIRDTYMGARWNYADRIAVRYNPEDVADGFITSEVIEDTFDPYATTDVYFGRYFDFSDKVGGRLSVSVQNVFDQEYTRWASYFFNQTQRAYGFPRTYTIGLSIDF